MTLMLALVTMLASWRRQAGVTVFTVVCLVTVVFWGLAIIGLLRVWVWLWR